MATEFTRDIKPITTAGTPVAPQPQGNLVSDLLNVASFGLDVFNQQENKRRDAEANRMTESLLSLETELTSNGLGRREVLSRLDAEIRRMAPDASTQSYLRDRVAGKRGSYLRRDLIAQVNAEEAQRQQFIQTQFNAAMENPALASQINFNPDGTVDEEEKLRMAEVSRNYYKDQADKEEQRASAAKMAAGTIKEAKQGVGTLAQVIGAEISLPLQSAYNSYLTLLDANMDDPENLQAFLETNRNLVNTVNMYKGYVESEFNTYYGSNTDSGVLELVEANKNNMIGALDGIIEGLARAEASASKRISENLKLAKDGLNLEGLELFSTAAMMELVSPQAGNLLFKAMVNKNTELFNAALGDTSQGLYRALSQRDVNVQTIETLMDYMETGDTSKLNAPQMSVFYEAARDTINGPALEFQLSPKELDRVSGGLAGILGEAIITDDPAQIKEATSLLNSENFEIFMKQLPPQRQEALGRLAQRFNMDILADTSDGLLRKLGQISNLEEADITYNAETGQFEGTDRFVVPEGQLGGGFARVGRDFAGGGQSPLKREMDTTLQEANAALKAIRDNAQYQEGDLDTGVIIDTMLSQYLPPSIKVKGTLNPHVPEEGEQTQSAEPTPREIEMEEEVVRLRARIQELQAGAISLTQGSLEEQQERQALREQEERLRREQMGGSSDYAAQAEAQGVDLSTFEDGEYEDGNGNTVVIRNGQVVEVR